MCRIVLNKTDFVFYNYIIQEQNEQNRRVFLYIYWMIATIVLSTSEMPWILIPGL
jgi:hypothetical protein